MLYPTTSDVLACQVKPTLCDCDCEPTPVRLCVAVEFEPLLANEAVAVIVPELCGANVMLYGTLCPDAMVNGKVSPLNVYWELLRVAEETVIVVPDALRLPEMLLFFPTVTWPKSIVAGDTTRVPAVTPVPERGSFAVVPRYENAILPLSLPELLGVYVTVNV